jgi:myo-inositol-1(or 4)-monophosphatase
VTATLPIAASLADELLDVAVQAASAGAAELRRRFGGVRTVAYKSTATDPVSDADHASERLVIGTILSARPDDGLLGEEGADRASATGLRWVVDPLDGTVNYLYGNPHWSVSVACEQRYGDEWRAVVGVVVDPVRDEMFTALSGRGAWLGDERLSVNDPVPLEHALVATGFSYSERSRERQAQVVAELLPRARDIRRGGSAALDLCWVAAGRVDGYYEDEMGLWDRAAGALIATEAGAVVTPLRLGVIAAGPALHPELEKAVAALATAPAQELSAGGQ